MRMVVDGVAFQTPPRPAAAPLPLWSVLIDALGAIGDVDLVVLDRGGLRRPVAGAIPFPPQVHADSARDSILLQRMCDHLGADVFLSTGFTTPLRTPSLLLYANGVPADSVADSREEAIALTYARAICVSPNADDAVAGGGERVTVLRTAIDAGRAADLAAELHGTARRIAASGGEADAAFLTQWERLRRLQAGVDVR